MLLRAGDAVAVEPVNDESNVFEGRSIRQNRRDFFVLACHDLSVVHGKFEQLTQVALELLDHEARSVAVLRHDCRRLQDLIGQRVARG